jgi:hypothetical protein
MTVSPVLCSEWLGELPRRNHFACLDVDGVEDHCALDEPAGTSLALDLEPPIVGQSAVEGVAASQVDRRHFLRLP